MNKARRSKEYELLSSEEGLYDMYDPSQASMEMETLLGGNFVAMNKCLILLNKSL